MVTTVDPAAFVLDSPGLLCGAGVVIRDLLWRFYKARTSKIKCPISHPISCTSAVISLVAHTAVECLQALSVVLFLACY